MLQELLNTLNIKYAKPFEDIKLHRDMIGYVCVVYSGNDRYILKLFRSNQTNQAIQSIEIMKYLLESDYPTPNIITTADGMPYFFFHEQEESRIGVLYEFVEGIEPDKNKEIENIGRHTGKLHHIMKGYPTDLDHHGKVFFIDRYINLLTKMCYPRVDRFKEHGDMLWKRVEGLSNGFCHGDYHTGNMLLNAKGQNVLFDFDAAAIAFSVYDIAVICDMTNYFEFTEQGYADTDGMLRRFLTGYGEQNRVSEEEIQSVYDFIAIRHYEVQATIVENLGLACIDEAFVDDQFEWLMKWEKLCKMIN
ncbi:MAG: aminoglycoside phosphotransferase [Herbinix sp.]|jgi:Ser/Thr protein kinase RdoA (MazF antagonist)|nr:aminoglycoside phosphotransferase [Herbinix sp.]